MDERLVELIVAVLVAVLGFFTGKRSENARIARHPGNNFDPKTTPLD